MGTEVKFYHSEMTGAPALSGQAGALIAVLDACLLNGFGLGTADSLTVSGGIATVTRAAGHSMEVNTVALIAGITGTYAALNGEQRVLSVTSTTFTFDATGQPDGTAAGTITQKVAPASSYWTKAFSGTNLAAYRSTDPTGLGFYLRVDDTGTTDARVVGYETMSDVNTGTGPFPTAAQISGGGFWSKSNAASSATRKWVIAADSRGFYKAIQFNSGNTEAYETSYFGDIIPVSAVDVYSAALSCGTSAGINGTPPRGNVAGELMYSVNNAASNSSVYSPRSYSGLGTSVINRTGFGFLPGAYTNANTILSGGTVPVGYPNAADTGLYLSAFGLYEVSQNTYRGLFPGAYAVPMSLAAFSGLTKDSLTGVTGYSGKTFRFVRSADPGIAGGWFVDNTGPWR